MAKSKVKKKIKDSIRAVNRAILRHRRGPTTYIISFPKCGRTWLRLMIGRYLAQHFDLQTEDYLNVQNFYEKNSTIPILSFYHDDKPYKRKASELTQDKSEYKNDHVVLLVRDPRDVVLSRYYAQQYRENVKWVGTLSEYLRKESGSLAAIVEYYNIWLREQNKAKKFMLMTYEDLHKNANFELKRVLEFFDIGKIDDKIVQEAVEFASFQNMRRFEHEDAFGERMLQPAEKGDFRSYKTRKGIVGDYRNEFEPDDQAFAEKYLKDHLDPKLGYGD